MAHTPSIEEKSHDKQLDSATPELLDDSQVTGYGTTNPEDDVKLSSKTWITLFSVSMLALTVTLCISAPSAVVTYIVRDFGPSTAYAAPWIINATNVLQAVIGPPVSFATDLYGRRNVLVVVTCLGVAGTFVSGSGTSIWMVIAGQMLTGCSLALKPICYAIASEVMPRKYRVLVQYWINILAGVAGLVGTLAGAAFVAARNPSGWRHLFYLEGACLAVGLIGVVFFYRPPPRPTTERSYNFSQRVKSLDLVGWFILATAITTFLVGITFGGVRYPWTDAKSLAPLIIGILGIFAFAGWETWGTKEGLAHHSLFQNRQFAIALGAMFLEGALLFGILSQYSTQSARLFSTAPMALGWRLSPFWWANLIANFPLAAFSHYYQDAKWALFGGYAFFTVSGVLFITAKVDSSVQFLVGDAMAGAGFAAPLCLLIVVAQLCTPPKLIGTASALMSTSRAVGAAVGTAAYTAILSNKLATRLGPAVAGALVANGLPGANVQAATAAVIASANAGYNPRPALAAPGMTAALLVPAYAAARQAYLESYRFVWALFLAFGVIATISVLFLGSIRQHFTNQVDAPVERVNESVKNKIGDAAA